MEPYFIPTGLGKFQMCICPECSGGVTSQVTVTIEGGDIYYLASCGRRSHCAKAKEAQEALEKGHDPRVLHAANVLDIEEIFIQPFGKTEKCKLLQWIAFKADPAAAAPIPEPPKISQAQQREEETLHQVNKEWGWEARMGWWRRANGKRVRIERLPLNEFICSVQAIQAANFSRVTKRIAWIKQLVRQKINYEYPAEALEVGHAEAGRKLEEFQEDAEIRGLL